jgi:hypothetical protein
MFFSTKNEAKPLIQTFHRAMFMYGEDAPCYSAPRMLEEALGESLRCEEFKDWSYSIQVPIL